MRAYLLDGEPRSQVELAKEAGVTQSAVFKSNSALSGLIGRSPKWRRGVLSDSVAFISRFAGLSICGGAHAQALPWLRL